MIFKQKIVKKLGNLEILFLKMIINRKIKKLIHKSLS